MDREILLVLGTAGAIGVVHTLLGPDHYLPFVALARARRWSTRRTAAVTLACGVGHVLSSILLGIVGVAAGTAVAKLEAIEAARGEWAAWALIAFGLVYLAWGIRRASAGHGHHHLGAGAAIADLRHAAEQGRAPTPSAAGVSGWALFIAFVLGPCEPLIPLLMAPAATGGLLAATAVTAVFAAATLGTMLTVVLAARAGLARVPLASFERWSHAAAGAAILACGLGLRWLGL